MAQISNAAAVEAAVLDTAAAGKYLNLAPRTLERWRWTGRGPKFVAISPRKVGYLRTDLDAWLASLTRTSTSDTGASARGEAT